MGYFFLYFVERESFYDSW